MKVRIQGDSVAMGMYATGMFPLLHLNETSNEINERPKRLVFADDFTVAGKLQELRSWQDSIVSHRPKLVIMQKQVRTGSL